ncbi:MULTISPECIES: hypothetical protein [unclassified Mycobacteroides]|uniref:hypothetical protein n=1 Tax=unclassified Mycobacteroides TaxID=2618759 RepID=UPI001328CB5C|nr:MULTISPECIES: hypothetical protein [unclassified Mycobacteroides]MUM17148.1 hypothetical protein [Mycobacteroides sp. CBMA 326]
MTDQNYMNFFVERPASAASVLRACATACGLLLESDDHPVDDADGYLQITQYTDGFEMGLCIIWPPTSPVTRPQEAVAQAIADELRQRVIFDVEDANAESGERWILATPGGTVAEVDVVEYDDGVGLPVFD